VCLALPPVIPEEAKASVRQRVDNGYTPGIVICMVNADGRTCYSYGGLSHEPGSFPTDESAIYEIGSVTKTFTTILLAQMVEAGNVALSDTVASFLPEGVEMPANGGDEITLEQLANHTSAIPSTPPNLAATVTDLANQFANYTIDHLYEFLNTYTLTRAPGSTYEYSNAGNALLGHVLALSQGVDYETLLRQRVIDPMGLIDTAITLTPSQDSRRAPPHHGVVERPPFEMNILGAAGALKSCAYDLGTYLEYNLGLIDGPLTSAIDLSHQQSTGLSGSGGYTTALGWWLWDDGDLVQHGGDTFGSTTFVGFRKSTGTGVVVLSNNRAHFPAAITDLGFHCLDTSDPLDEVPEATPVSESRLREIAGDYGIPQIRMQHGRPVLGLTGQIDFTAYSNNRGGLAVLDLGLEIFMDFNRDPISGDVSSMDVAQNGNGPTRFNRVRRAGILTLATDPETGGLLLSVDGEADRDYPFEVSTDLKNWIQDGTMAIWDLPKSEAVSGISKKYFRIREP